MNDLAFADCARPTPVAILRLALMPYSLGHEVLLLKERNPFVMCHVEQFSDLPLEQQIYAVKRAALICSQGWRSNHGRQKWLRLWGWLTSKSDYALAIAEFRNYLNEGRMLPSPPSRHAVEVLYGKEDEKGRAMGSPLAAQLYNYVCANLGKFNVTPATAWDAPYSLAGMLYFAELESAGQIRIENAAEAGEQAELEKIQREIEEEQAAQPKTNNAGLATEPPDLS
jgi:hypothetical protein